MTLITKWIGGLALAGVFAMVLSTSAVAGDMTVSSGKKLMETPMIEEAEPWWSGGVTVGYDSKYIFRGVEIFGESGPADNLVWADVSFSAYGFTAGAWYASSASSSEYNELNLYASYTYSIGPVDLTGGGIYYYFPYVDGGNNDTWELFAGLDYSILADGLLTASLYYYYDFDAFEGGYLELQLSSSIPLYKGAEGDTIVSLDPYALVSLDNEYNSDETELNHLQFGVGLTWNLSSSVALAGYVAYLEPLDAIDDFQDGEWWGGGSISVSF